MFKNNMKGFEEVNFEYKGDKRRKEKEILALETMKKLILHLVNYCPYCGRKL